MEAASYFKNVVKSKPLLSQVQHSAVANSVYQKEPARSVTCFLPLLPPCPTQGCCYNYCVSLYHCRTYLTNDV